MDESDGGGGTKMDDATRGTRSGSETRRRGGIIGFRATDAERAELVAKADKAGLTLGSYIRAAALTRPATRATRRAPVEHAALAQLLGQIGRVGGNIHQITRRLNFGDVRAAEDVPQALKELRGMKALLMQALGRGSAEEDA